MALILLDEIRMFWDHCPFICYSSLETPTVLNIILCHYDTSGAKRP